ncbi:Acetyltransferase (GNAT) domain-containing protein [Ekhidna lutea]|uniref:Acetyltransferase (GNAT) domain-containing protein n=2 Tax=Ekhidna lutea TaxID=447679 RepID=A0A239K4M8_EKHLU|nr:Acetyltransferase (GNAT) domain-containing protein [Ekhidna lutea]
MSTTYYHPKYFESQDYNEFIVYSQGGLFIAFDLDGEKAISIPRSPFGSVLKQKESIEELESFFEKIRVDLKAKSIKEVIIHHPSEIYESYASIDWLTSVLGEPVYTDINQSIALEENFSEKLHKMQKRKLDSLINEGFTFRKMEDHEFETAHKFLKVCRQAQGLQINISWEQLNKLKQNLPERYECFGVFREEKISALCITVRVTDRIAYYFLPATSPMFRNQSPMVMLIVGIVDYYRKNNFSFLDLGVSSIHGKPQDTLRMFKERMGATESQKPTFRLHL